MPRLVILWLKSLIDKFRKHLVLQNLEMLVEAGEILFHPSTLSFFLITCLYGIKVVVSVASNRLKFGPKANTKLCRWFWRMYCWGGAHWWVYNWALPRVSIYKFIWYHCHLSELLSVFDIQRLLLNHVWTRLRYFPYYIVVMFQNFYWIM